MTDDRQGDRAARTRERRVSAGQRGSQRAPASVAQAELDCGQDQAPPTMIIPSTITRQGMPRAGLPRAADRPLTSPAELPAASTRCEHVARRRDSSSTIIRERREAAPRSDVRGKFERTGRRTRARGVAADEPQGDHRRPLQCRSVEDGDGRRVPQAHSYDGVRSNPDAFAPCQLDDVGDSSPHVRQRVGGSRFTCVAT